MLSRFVLAILALTMLLQLSGCGSYSLGTAGKLPFQTIYVEPARNNSYAPQVSAPLTDNIIERLQQHPGLKVVETGGADVTLKTTVVNYRRTVGATQSRDTALAQSYILTLDCNITLVDNRTGEEIMPTRLVSAKQQAFVDGGFLTAEYQAIPVLTREMAKNISNEVVSVW